METLNLSDPLLLIGGLIFLSLAPFAAMMVTSFIKLTVVLQLVRNAMGVQNIPPNMVINGLAIVLSFYVMAPVAYEMIDIVHAVNPDIKDFRALVEALEQAREPLRDFLLKHSAPRERAFFFNAAQSVWPAEQLGKLGENDFVLLVPAFTVTELTTAFQVGFLLYLPFVAIDLIVSNILLALGMMMVSPMTISLPFKLLLFVLVEGWARVIHGLVLSYA
ncbi:type III secretion system export apparatus subunit SctR [Acanthopleuribacter pedis]|uniref:Type III secretion system export apparatus subunit SctR n=1 Tax=Acanthopleuribacter pedis TaxID=442870 RepID=A0A8J7QEU1_9BACT|nr:type III secretion system export apparatus subunit SctR [Acanthopleuribacter pedis]MBO1322974.1 type III secretion system export apparatus subunit SctR [Acanthopleuribacter pedis]